MSSYTEYDDDTESSSSSDDGYENQIIDSADEKLLEYLELATKDNLLEFECIFGTNPKNPSMAWNEKYIERTEFVNIIKYFSENDNYVSLGENTSLDIRCEQVFRGKRVLTNCRFTIDGLSNIKKYCVTDSLDNIPFTLTKKSHHKIKNNIAFPVVIYDYGFRANIKKEQELNAFSNQEGSLLLKKWKQLNKSSDTKKDILLKLKINCSE